MESKIGVYILCCNRLLRESIARVLTKKANFQVFTAQVIGPAAREELANSGAHVLILDSLQLLLDDGAAISRTLADNRSINCVLVAMEDDKKQFLTAVRLGALGYVLQEASAVDVVAAI